VHKKIAYGGIATALCVIMLVLSSYLPTLKAATLFSASAVVYIYCMITNPKAAFAMYLASSVLGFLIVSAASPVILLSFAICFGNYPVIRGFIERKNIVLSTVLKLLAYTVYFALMFYATKHFLVMPLPFAWWILYALGAVLFFAYDFLLKSTGEYIFRIFYTLKH
jgi:hypothetical protein